MSKFTGQHYEAVAKILAEHRWVVINNLPSDLIPAFCKLFQEDNEHFDSEKFIEACQNRE